MRHSQLKAFHHVALLGGFSAAARALGLTQPAISEQVRALERAHDVHLFDRTRREVALTLSGRRLFRLTERYFETEAEIAGLLSEARAVPGGRLRLIVDNPIHITGLLAAFQRRFPRVSLQLRTGNSAAVLAALDAYEAEIGLIGSAGPGRGWTMLELGASPIVGFARTGLVPGAENGMALAELLKYPLVLREEGSQTRFALMAAARERGLSVTPAIEVEGQEAMREIVASGVGVGFVSRAELVADARLEVLPIRDARLEMRENLVHVSARADVRVIRSFMDFARISLAGRDRVAAATGPDGP